ncbi:MAG: alginate lyase family protein [Chloroflexi bacterium]|nr:alginate lyase family protein [Chloroflexota bacterium]
MPRNAAESVAHAAPASSLPLLARTARYLRPDQVLARASFVLERRLDRARPGLLSRHYARELHRLLASTRDAAAIWRWPAAPLDPAARADPERARSIVEGRFVFLNQAHCLDDPARWDVEGASRLWLFHLHAFEYAVDLAVAARQQERNAYPCLRALVQSWLAAHPPSGDDPWHPFPVASRLSAWLVARDLLQPWLRDDPAFAAQLRAAILTHAAFLADHLEHDVGGNHLLKNGVALLLAGCAFEGPAAGGWRRRASRVLAKELPRQVLADGGHYERSPMYQLLVLADLLAALFAAGRRELPIAVPLARAVHRMQRFAVTLVHPDGEIPLFKDAALGEAPRPGQLVGPSTEPRGNALAASSYFGLPVGPGSVLLADCGPPGPDDLPAHAHADALAFELSVGGRRVLVDGGVDEYAAGPRRDLLRGTSSHNTVEVDGEPQSEVWGSFRVGRRARVRCVWWEERGDGSSLVGAHDGYLRLGLRHERRFDAVPGVGWRILDRLVGHGRHVAVARYRLHPGLGWRWRGADAFAAVDEHGQDLLTLRPIGRITIWRESGIYAERFGRIEAVDVLCLVHRDPPPALFGAWLTLPGRQPTVA